MVKNIMFVCTGNSCRSPMAEAIAKEIFEKNSISCNVYSRGISVIIELGASENACGAMSSRGLSLESHMTRQVSLLDIEKADIVLAMTKQHKAYLLTKAKAHKNKIFTLAEYVGKQNDVCDPFGGSLSVYEACASELAELITLLAEKLIESEKGGKNDSNC